MVKQEEDGLYFKVNVAIRKYGDKHGGVGDCDIITALAEIIADVMSLHNPDTHDVTYKFIDRCIAAKIAINRENGIGDEVGEQTRTLHS